MARRLRVSTDGYCAPNPGGLATWAFVAATDADAAPLHEAAGVAARAPEGTNEVAEWRAAFEALDWLLAHAEDGDAVAFAVDHARVATALAGESGVPAEGEPRRLAQECRRLTFALRDRGVAVTFERVPRWENAAADRLASEAHARALAGAGDEGETHDLPPSRRGNR